MPGPSPPYHHPPGSRATTRAAPSSTDQLAPDHFVTLSEVRLVRSRDLGVVFIIILGPVFRTDPFRYLVGPGHIGQGRGPGRREDAFIFDRQMKLQELASVIA